MNLQALVEILGRLKPDYGEAITQDTPLIDLGLSSLDMMIILCELEHAYGTDIRLDTLRGIRTVGQLYAAIME